MLFSNSLEAIEGHHGKTGIGGSSLKNNKSKRGRYRSSKNKEKDDRIFTEPQKLI